MITQKTSYITWTNGIKDLMFLRDLDDIGPSNGKSGRSDSRSMYWACLHKLSKFYAKKSPPNHWTCKQKNNHFPTSVSTLSSSLDKMKNYSHKKNPLNLLLCKASFYLRDIGFGLTPHRSKALRPKAQQL